VLRIYYLILFLLNNFRLTPIDTPIPIYIPTPILIFAFKIKIFIF